MGALPITSLSKETRSKHLRRWKGNIRTATTKTLKREGRKERKGKRTKKGTMRGDIAFCWFIPS
jgi:hypothetical protein